MVSCYEIRNREADVSLFLSLNTGTFLLKITNLGEYFNAVVVSSSLSVMAYFSISQCIKVVHHYFLKGSLLSCIN
jgi:hypothetical protein